MQALVLSGSKCILDKFIPSNTIFQVLLKNFFGSQVKHDQDGQLETPVALFIFRRPAPTLEVFQAIREVKPRELFIVADGPRPNNPSEADLVTATREVVENIDWPCEVHRIYSDRN